MKPLVVTLRVEAFLRALAERSLTQTAFAAQAGLDRHHLNAVVCGHRVPGPRIRTKMLAALGVPFDTIFTIASPQGTSSRRRRKPRVRAAS